MTFPATTAAHATAVARWCLATFGRQWKVAIVTPLGSERRYLVIVG